MVSARERRAKGGYNDGCFTSMPLKPLVNPGCRVVSFASCSAQRLKLGYLGGDAPVCVSDLDSLANSSGFFASMAGCRCLLFVRNGRGWRGLPR